jgi:hypothetical protein
MEMKMRENWPIFNGYFPKGNETYCVNHFYTEITFLILSYFVYV